MLLIKIITHTNGTGKWDALHVITLSFDYNATPKQNGSQEKSKHVTQEYKNEAGCQLTEQKLHEFYAKISDVYDLWDITRKLIY